MGIPIPQQNGSQAPVVASQEQSGATQRHYGDPKTGCREDEVALRIDGLIGTVCSPACSKQGKCPTDVPRGVTAQPSCSFTFRGERRCALKCAPGECGAGHCRRSGSVCTYDASSNEVGRIPLET